MHYQARVFTEFVKKYFPDAFQNKKVLDVGSGDINGNNRFLFTECEYDGNDVFAAKNVTVVSKTTALPFETATFDTIISTECFEHDPEYEGSFRKIVDMLKPGGLFCFTCASTGRPEHGTRRTSPGDSYGTIGNVEGWTDYYKNLTFEDLDTAVNVRGTFRDFRAYYNAESKDLYFWGIKKGAESHDTSSVPPYRANGIMCTSH
jgi:SAM-dependent methyltransferase